MKKIFTLPLFLSAILIFAGCRLFWECGGNICIMECEHGSLYVEKDRTEKGMFIITAAPENGYYITEDDIYVVLQNDGEYMMNEFISVYKISDTQFYFELEEKTCDVTVSGCFRKSAE